MLAREPDRESMIVEIRVARVVWRVGEGFERVMRGVSLRVQKLLTYLRDRRGDADWLVSGPHFTSRLG
jgi:hypothetical protein